MIYNSVPLAMCVLSLYNAISYFGDGNMININDVSCNTNDVTPMMQQYFAAKQAHPGIIVFFRMGDFYELFFDDAKVVSSELNIALTTRGKHIGEDIPMCGVPVASIDYHLAKLVKLGYRVAICEQTETPEEAKKKGHKIVSRDVTRIVTPGTVIEDAFLLSKEDNFLMSVVPKMKKNDVLSVSFAVADISTDKFFSNTVAAGDFFSALEQYSPKEVLLPTYAAESEWVKVIKPYISGHITTLADSKFNRITEEKRLLEYYQVSTLDGFGISIDEEISACGAIVEYVTVTQCTNRQRLSKPSKIQQSKFMVIDSATHRNLEIVHSSNDDKNSLLRCIDSTVTAFGGRLLCSRMVTPIMDIDELNDRLDSVTFFVRNNDLRNELREILRRCPDIERTIVRMRFGKYSPKDFGAILQGVSCIRSIINRVCEEKIKIENKFSHHELSDFKDLYNELERALEDELPVQYKGGCVIKQGYSDKLDAAKELVINGRNLIADLQLKYVNTYGINTLKIKNNNILGWYIEIPLSQRSKVGDEFIHKQTLVNNVRYVTDELNDLQMKMAQASDDLVALETQIISELANKIVAQAEEFDAAINYMSRLDIALSMAHIADERQYVRPCLSIDNKVYIKGGRHPVLELMVDEFVPNDCELEGEARMSILTGPNMAGKSTYLRQNALIVLMSHIGSYVPATEAIIGITDRLFSRIGASDDLAKGRSTFMVEMIETASILNQATERSFVILDEVGRGTSTYDGISIAWSVVEHLYYTNRCRTIFATHYMELTSIKRDILDLKCQTLKVQECKGKVLFCHSIVDGIADKAYGVYVAKLAGLPKAVTNKASILLKKLEKHRLSHAMQISEQLSMFEPLQHDLEENPDVVDTDYSDVIAEISELDINNITPKAALDFLYEIKQKISYTHESEDVFAANGKSIKL